MYGRNWTEKATAVKRAAGFRCEYIYSDGSRCQCTVTLQCHHETYSRFLNERGSDLTCLCQVHHLKVHGRLGSSRSRLRRK